MSELLQKPNLETFSEVGSISLGPAQVTNWPQIEIEDEKDKQIALDLALWKAEEQRYKKNIEIELGLGGRWEGKLQYTEGIDLKIKSLETLELIIKNCMKRSCYPYFKPLSLKSEIDYVVKDERSQSKYYLIIKYYLQTRDGVKPSSFQDYDLGGIYRMIQKEKESFEIDEINPAEIPF